jgi:hypothetical protein
MQDIPFEFPGKLNTKLIAGYLHIDICAWQTTNYPPISERKVDDIFGWQRFCE